MSDLSEAACIKAALDQLVIGVDIPYPPDDGGVSFLHAGKSSFFVTVSEEEARAAQDELDREIEVSDDVIDTFMNEAFALVAGKDRVKTRLIVRRSFTAALKQMRAERGGA